MRAAALATAAALAHVVLSGPVALQLGEKRWLLQPSRLARLLELPAGGATALRIGGPAAVAWLARLGRTVETRPHDATFAVNGPHVNIVPAKPASGSTRRRRPTLCSGRRCTGFPDAASRCSRSSSSRRSSRPPRRGSSGSTASSRRTRRSTAASRTGSTTSQLVAHLVDDKLIAPDEEFSFNKTTGARTAAKGFSRRP